MRKLILILITGVIPISLFSQNWVEQFYSPTDSKNTESFYDIQKNFNDYWSSYDIKGGFYYIDGEMFKAAGWKQFKRWEWLWETRVDAKTGAFPETNLFNVHRGFYKNRKSVEDASNWVQMGPDRSTGGYAGIGRLNVIEFHPTDPNTIWVGAPSGGLWKTDDGGNTWDVLTDNLPVIGVSGIIIPNDYETSQTIYIATGDRDAGDNYSIGVLKSTDAGQTWNQTGLTFPVSSRYRITRLLVHPRDQNIFYAATNGGIFKTSNSGANWTQVLNGLFFDMEFKYNCEDTVLFAVTADYNGSSKIFKTKNAGSSWNEVYSFPNSVYRVELDVAQSDSTIVYALASTQAGGMDGIYKSTDSGNSFTKIYDGTQSGKNLLNWHKNSTDTGGQGWFDLTLSVSPTDKNTVYLGGVNAWKSTDGGFTWDIVNHWYGAGGVPAVHADKHYMEFYNPNTFYEANDGGIYKTTNGGASWVDLTNGMVISQMYKLGVSQTVKDEVITGLQDNGSKLMTSSGLWYDVKGGDGMECIIDYEDVKIQYATYVYGQIDRTTDRWSTSTNRVNISANIPGGPAGAWVTPYLLDPNDNKVLYVGYADVWKTTDRGNTWTKISNLFLTNKIRSMAIAPADSRTLYVTDFNNFFRTTNGGGLWTDLTSKLPNTSNAITYITVDNLDPNKVWITYGGYDNIKVFQSIDGGENWQNISAGLPSVPANAVYQNKLSKNQHLYVGTDIGVFFREGDGEWQLFSKNLPSVIVTELEIHYDKVNPEQSVLYASTYGRGLWKSNLSPFKEPEIMIDDLVGPFYVSNDSTAKIEISFKVNETFNGNKFTVYLSDDEGSFNTLLAVGEIETDAEGIIEAIIPKGTQTSDMYRVKMTSSSPEFESPMSNPFEIVLDVEPPTITISSDEVASTSTESFDVTITFSKDVAGFEQSDIAITNAEINTLTSTNLRDYVVNISPAESGYVTIDVQADVVHDMLGNWNTASDQWSINYILTSIEKLSEMGVRIFPNPSNGKFTLEIGNQHKQLEISVLDVSGKQVFKRQFSGSASQNVDLTHLHKGIYLVRVNMNNKELVSKIVIE
jgi:photosystem II stability/assembly factor-like uncharacterized protein